MCRLLRRGSGEDDSEDSDDEPPELMEGPEFQALIPQLRERPENPRTQSCSGCRARWHRPMHLALQTRVPLSSHSPQRESRFLSLLSDSASRACSL